MGIHNGGGASGARLPRRSWLGLAAGALSGWFYRALAKGRRDNRDAAACIRPPGACAEGFNALCARCGNCMAVCPYNLIQPDSGGSGVDGLLTPVLRFRSRNSRQEEHCHYDCTACSQVCPTGALRPLALELKPRIAIGTAEINRSWCVVWAEREHCTVCQDMCLYDAVFEVERDGSNGPIVDSSKCNGCGACESLCPAAPIAIVVKGCSPQRVLAPHH